MDLIVCGIVTAIIAGSLGFLFGVMFNANSYDRGLKDGIKQAFAFQNLSDSELSEKLMEKIKENS